MITNAQAEKLNTKRLLTYFKTIRSFPSEADEWEELTEGQISRQEEINAHVQFVNELLNKREHVNR